MRYDEATRFLQDHQPLPENIDFDQELLDRLADVIRYFDDHPDPRCIELFLGAMAGGGGAAGCYDQILGMLSMYDHEAKVSATVNAFTSSNDSLNRTWVLSFAQQLEDRRMLPHVRQALLSNEEMERLAAVEVLRRIARKEDLPWIMKVCETDSSEEVRRRLSLIATQIRES